MTLVHEHAKVKGERRIPARADGPRMKELNETGFS